MEKPSRPTGALATSRSSPLDVFLTCKSSCSPRVTFHRSLFSFRLLLRRPPPLSPSVFGSYDRQKDLQAEQIWLCNMAAEGCALSGPKKCTIIPALCTHKQRLIIYLFILGLSNECNFKSRFIFPIVDLDESRDLIWFACLQFCCFSISLHINVKKFLNLVTKMRLNK